MIRPDLVYHRPNPMFHYWTMGVSDKWYGLTFQSLAEARIFDTAVHAVLEELQAASVTTEAMAFVREVSSARSEREGGVDIVPLATASVSLPSGVAKASFRGPVAFPARSPFAVFSELTHGDESAAKQGK